MKRPATVEPLSVAPAAELLDLLRDHVDPAILDQAIVRDAVARFGPFDPERAVEVRDRLAADHPRDLHVRFWLNALIREAR